MRHQTPGSAGLVEQRTEGNGRLAAGSVEGRRCAAEPHRMARHAPILVGFDQTSVGEEAEPRRGGLAAKIHRCDWNDWIRPDGIVYS